MFAKWANTTASPEKFFPFTSVLVAAWFGGLLFLCRIGSTRKDWLSVVARSPSAIWINWKGTSISPDFETPRLVFNVVMASHPDPLRALMLELSSPLLKLLGYPA